MPAMISYAQNNEDALLHRIFGNQPIGFYIDIGAAHPEHLSVTKHFYDRGWQGINVDPLRSSIELFNERRPRDLNLNLAISSQDGQREFFEVPDYLELSTFSPYKSLTDKYETTAYQVETLSGNSLFMQYVNRPVDFMKIDVEGAEFDVVNSIDFSTHRPKVLVIEATLPNAAFPGWQNLAAIENFVNWESLLLKSGYLFAYFDGLNRFYVSQENKHLLIFFSIGPCLWDNFTTQAVANRIQELEKHCDDRMQQVHTLTAMLKDSEKDRAARGEQIVTLTSMVKQLQRK